MDTDVIVLGAGIVGLGTALQLQARGRGVVLVDRGQAGAATSYGNAGIIESASYFPYAFPHQFSEILRVALNRETDVSYHWSALPKVAPFLARYWWHSFPERHRKAMEGNVPLIENCFSEHLPLIEAAGAMHLVRKTGWIKFYRTQKKLDEAVADAESLKPMGLHAETLDAKGFAEREPHIKETVAGAVHFTDPVNIADPQELSTAYLKLFESRGGSFIPGDARSLAQEGASWTVKTEQGLVRAKDAVVALGPWAPDLVSSFGYDLPMAVKRGYHKHYKPLGNAVLNHTLLDGDVRYCIVPMLKGIRITTGAEFAERDAPPTPVQLERIEPRARALFPLGEAVEKEPWMGSRPCTPDMLPVIGPAPRHKGLWFAFGHAHHGLTNAAITGRLIAEMVTGSETLFDVTPYRVDRF
jgi:D-amino-acid dehydrogenase